MTRPRSPSIATEPSRSQGRFVVRAIARLLPRPDYGELRIVLPDGHEIGLRGREAGPHAIMTMHRWRGLWRILRTGEAGFGSGYIAGDWSTPDLIGLFDFLLRNEAAFDAAANSWIARALDRLHHGTRLNTRRGSRRNIAAHYDLGNEFYRHWLDSGMNYSSAIYRGEESLEEAQTAKLDRIAGLLGLRGGERVLEIGCGWGAMAQHLVRKFGASVTALTLSAAQLQYARKRLASEIAAGSADFRLQDYRDVSGHFDRIVSVEMFEAVGERYWPTYFERLASCLTQGGVAVLQIITIAPERFATYRARPDFIQRHIFPGGMLPTAEAVERQAANARFKVAHRETFGTSYARTLQEWRGRFLRSWKDIEASGFDVNFKRMWEYYLAYCEIGFRHRMIDVSIFKLERT